MSNIEALQGFSSQMEAKKSGSEDTLGKTDFLKLLVTQLENQDPLNPSDPTEFTAQLAQYSSLEQLTNINDSMETFDSMQAESERLSALSLIGKNVISDADSFQYDGQPIELGYQFESDMEQATFYVKDEAGQVVDKVQAGAVSAGEHFLTWPEEGEAGKFAEGAYQLEVLGTNADGKEVQGTTRVGSRVTGVDFAESDSTLLTPNGNISLADVTRVNNSTQTD
ncbi:MAG: flagellar hook assembly protein FlgD [Thermodesulfobacteriota bacterium]